MIDRVLDLLEQVIASYRPERLAALQSARSAFSPSAPDPHIIARFTTEMVRFEETIHQALHKTSALLDAHVRWHDDLTATLVHDLRSPLQSLILALQMVTTDYQSDSAMTQHLLQVAARNANNLRELIQLILETNQLTAGQLKIAWGSVGAEALVSDACAPLQLLLEANQLSLSTEIEARITTLWCDEQLLRRVLQNLVSNAIKFTPPGGQIGIRVSLDPTGSRIEIAVRDTGAGIAPAALVKVFDRYYQADTEARKGNGLGLYFCRLAAEAHGGTIRAASQVGLGTTISVSLPLRPPLTALL